MERDDMCPICLSDCMIDIVTPSGCGHKFCRNCLARWSKNHSNCPMCRIEMRPIQPKQTQSMVKQNSPSPLWGGPELSLKLKQSQYLMRPPTAAEINESRRKRRPNNQQTPSITQRDQPWRQTWCDPEALLIYNAALSTKQKKSKISHLILKILDANEPMNWERLPGLTNIVTKQSM